MAYKLKNGKIYQAEVDNLHPAMRPFTDSFIVSNPGQNYTVRVNFTTESRIPLKTDFFAGKMIVRASKRYFGIIVPELDGGVFPTFVGKNVNADRKDRKCFK